MFESMYAGLDQAALLAAIEQAARDEAQAGARKMAAIAELVDITVAEDDERGGWAFDPWKNATAQLGAVLSMGKRRASGQMWIAVALRYRLPKVAELYLQGRLNARLVSEITWRTQLVADDVVAAVDAAIATQTHRWGALSDAKLTASIDAVIERHDPDAVRRAREVIHARDVRIGAHDDPSATATIWGQLMAGDAAALEQLIAGMVRGVCAEDPRSAGERRSDAMGAFIQGNEHLQCRCGSPTCVAAGPAKSRVVIQVIADAAAVDAAKDLIADQDRQHSEAVQCQPDSGIALLPGAQVLPVAALAEAIRGGAAITELWVPGPDPELQYRPSAKLAAFVRARDLFCRFPGCDVPAERCDIDHVVPYPYGPTHASNLNCKCRDHHLAKTFWEGWHDQQLPDGTVIWTAPSGQCFTTMPGSRLYFPSWNITTAELPPVDRPPPDPGRTAKMPRRRRSRAAENAARIKAEREANAVLRALEELPVVEQQPDYGSDPPPF